MCMKKEFDVLPFGEAEQGRSNTFPKGSCRPCLNGAAKLVGERDGSHYFYVFFPS